MTALGKYDVVYSTHPELPNNPWGDDFSEVCRLIEAYDIVIVQRCYKFEVVRTLRIACDLLGKKLIFETDDDYFHLPTSNPCHQEVNQPGVLRGFVEVLRLADLITVSTQELKDVVYRFNKNVEVLPNNLETVNSGFAGRPSRAYGAEIVKEDGTVTIPNQHGLVSIPAYYRDKMGAKKRVIRIGYTGTPSHHEDWETVRYSFEKLVKKYEGRIWVVFIGDRYFYDKLEAGSKRKIHIPVAPYYHYMQHIRNFDIGLAPLVPNVFNMSKSEIKALEYGSWGVPSVLPHFVTYTRTFTHQKNCLTYYNSHEFFECLEELINNDQLREDLGAAARDLVMNSRLESQHALRRYEVYKTMILPPVKTFAPKVIA